MDGSDNTSLLAIDKAAVVQWRLLAVRHNLMSDTDVAWFLLRQYENLQSGNFCANCQSPLTLMCAKCTDSQQMSSFPLIPDLAEMHIKGEDFMAAEEKLTNDPSSHVENLTEPVGDGVKDEVHMNCERNHKAAEDSELVEESAAGKDVHDESVAAPSTVKSSRCRGSKVSVPASSRVRPRGRKKKRVRRSDVDSDVLTEDDPDIIGEGKQLLFNCTKCDARFFSLKYLNTHMLSHSGETVYPCDKCPAVFRAPRNLKNHLGTHTGNERYRCFGCGAAFTWYSSWKRHTQQHCLVGQQDSGVSQQEKAKHGESVHTSETAEQKKAECVDRESFQSTSEQEQRQKNNVSDRGQTQKTDQHDSEFTQDSTASRRWTCPKCHATFSTTKHLNTHMLSHKGKKVYPCDRCSAVYKNPRCLKDHIRSHTGKGLYRCGKCGTGFVWRSAQQYHEKQCEADKTASTVCDICGVDCHTAAKLKTHVNTHLKEYKCEDCGELFRVKLDLEKHMIKKHTLPKKHVCSVCGVAFGYKNSLILHMRSHTGERPHQCEQCGASFALPVCLRNHVLLHAEERRYACKLCDAAFKQPGGLQAHMTTHSNEKPFTCSVCGRSFARSVYLKNHMLSHTGVKAFVCKVCNQSFFRSTELKTHTYKHTGERPYVCKECGKSFIKNFYLTKHMRVHTGEKPYVCKECGTAFSFWASCRRHQKTHLPKGPVLK